MNKEFECWDPMDSDFSSLNFNSYDRGPGQDLAVDHLPSYAGSESLNEKKTVTLYVSKIPHDIEEQALRNIFAKYGKVVRLCIKRNTTNYFGFVDYATLMEAEKAISNINRKPPLFLQVDFATTKEEREMKEKLKKEELESRFNNNPVSEIDLPSYQEGNDTYISTNRSQNLRGTNKVEGQALDQVGNTLTNLKITTGNQGRVVSCDFVESLSLQQCNPSPHCTVQNSEILHHPVETHLIKSIPENVNFQKGYGRGIRPYSSQINAVHYNGFGEYSAFQSALPVCGRGHHQNSENQEYHPFLPSPNMPVSFSNSCGSCCCNHFPACYQQTCMNVSPRQFCGAHGIGTSHSNPNCCHHYSQSRYIIRQSGPGKVEYVTSSYNCQPASYSIPALLPLQCFVCKEEGKLRCSRCETPYCSEECQRKDWPIHKAKCMQTGFHMHSEKPKTVGKIQNQEFHDSSYVSGASNSESTYENTTHFRYSEASRQAKKHRIVEKKHVKEQNVSDSSQSSDGKERTPYNSIKPRQNYKNKSEGIRRELSHSRSEIKPELGKLKDISNSKTNSVINIHTKKVKQKMHDTMSEYASSSQVANATLSLKCIRDEQYSASSVTEKGVNASNLLPNNPSSCLINSHLSAETTETVKRILLPEKEVKKPKANDIKLNILNVGKCEKVIVCSIKSPDEIWVQLVKEQETLCKIESELKTLSKENILVDPSVGDICASLYTDDVLYRAKINLVLPDNKCEVYYIDYGNTAMTSVYDLFFLNETLPTYPAQAILCKLADIKPPNNAKKWSDSDISALNVLAYVYGNYKANIINSNLDKYEVDLIMEDGTSMAELLVNEHNADWILETNHISEDTKGSKAGFQNTYSITQHIPSVLPLLKDESEIKLIPFTTEDSSFWAWVYVENLIKSFKSVESAFTEKIIGVSDIKISLEQENYVAAFSPSQQKWHRSFIMHAGNKFFVRYVDYGHEEEVSEVCALEPDQLECSPLVHCVANDSFSSEMKHLLKEAETSKVCVSGILKYFSEEFIQLDIMNNSKIVCQLKGFPWYHGLTFDTSSCRTITKALSNKKREFTCASTAITNESPKSTATHSFAQIIMKDYIEEMELSKTSRTEVKVVHWKSAKEFYVQKISNKQDMNAKSKKINLYCNAQSNRKYIPVEGEIVFAKFSFDNQWYRSCVKKVMPDNKCCVYFIDYGNEEEVSYECIQHLPKEFAFPYLCACVSLHDIPEGKITEQEAITILSLDVWDLEVVDSLVSPKSINLFTSNLSLLNYLFEEDKNTKVIPKFNSNMQSANVQDSSETSVPQKQSLKSNPDLFDKAIIEIVHIEREIFFVHRVEDKHKFHSMMQAINKECNNHSKSYLPAIDDIVSARYNEDGNWYRGCVLEILEGRCKILFVDYGNREEVTFDSIQPLSQRFISVPLFSISVNLDGVPNKVFTQEVFEMLKSKKWQLEIVDKSSSPIKVKLFDKKKCCVNDCLYDKWFSSEKKIDASVLNYRKDINLCTDNHIQIRNKITLSCLKPIALTLNQILEVKLVWEENGKCFVQRVSDIPDTEILLKKLELYCTKEGHSSYTPVKDEIISAKCFFDNKWYRGCISEVLSENEYSVLFIDYGNSAMVSKNAIKDLPQELISYPIFCISVKFIEEEITLKLDLDQIYEIEVVDVIHENYFSVRILSPNVAETNHQKITSKTSCREVNDRSKEKSEESKLLFNEYSTVELPYGENVDLIIYSISSGNIYCSPYNEKNFGDLMELEKNISAFCYEHPADSYTPIESEMVLAKRISDGEWHRATVTSVTDGPIFLVYFVDYGNLDELPKECLRKMDEQFMLLPFQAHICKLGGVSLIEEHETDAICEMLKIVPCVQPLKATVIEDELPLICIPSVNEQLLKKGLAQPIPLCAQLHPSASTQTAEQSATLENIIEEYQELLLQQLAMLQRPQ